MRTYHRWFLPGATYFFTVVAANRHHTDILTRNIDDLRAAFRRVRETHPFKLLAIVVLPDHLHCLWELPFDDFDFSSRWQRIKADFSRHQLHGEFVSRSRRAKGERGIWQRRYWEHVIRDDEDFQRHLDYIHYNPVRHDLAASAMDWPHSSFRRWLQRGWYEPGWGVAGDVGKVPYGE